MGNWQKSGRFWTLVIVLIVLIAIIPLEIGAFDFRASSVTEDNLEPLVRLSLPSGSYDQAIDLELSSNHPEAAIYFTTDGSMPTPDDGTLYRQALHLPGVPQRTAVIRARAFPPSGEPGPVASATYFINLDVDLPLVSLIVDPEDLWHEQSGIFSQPDSRGIEWERDAEFFLYEPERSTGFQIPAGVRVHGTGSRINEKKSLRLYFREEYGQPTLRYPLFPDSERAEFKRLVLHSGGQDFPARSLSGSLIHNQLVGNLARKIGGFATYTRPVLLFLNGQLWGVYNLRERIDERYLLENFGIEDADLLTGFEHSLNVSAGDRSHWENFLQFATTNDLSEPENYAYLQTQVNMENYIDYLVFQFISANTDWPRNNQHKFRDRATGRWHWIYWDSDNAFGLLPGSYIEKNMFLHVLENEGEREAEAGVLFNKLFENPQFESKFLSRMADMLNTVFISEEVLAEIDTVAAALENVITYETRRWPGPGDWQAIIEYMREFARQRPEIVRDQAVEYFDLPGTALLRIDQAAGRHGSVIVNDKIALQADELPWEGIYFQGVDLKLTAVPARGYQFAGWDPPALPQTPSISFRPTGDLTITPLFEAADDDQPLAGDVQIQRFGIDGESAPVGGLQGDWVELQVRRLDSVDLRGWRLTDNDSKTAVDEGSIIIGQHEALAAVPAGTTILLVSEQSARNDRLFSEDDLSFIDGQIILYAGNDHLDVATDPWFALGPVDNLVLLAPGQSIDFADDQAIDFLRVGEGNSLVTPADFGLLGESTSNTPISSPRG